MNDYYSVYLTEEQLYEYACEFIDIVQTVNNLEEYIQRDVSSQNNPILYSLNYFLHYFIDLNEIDILEANKQVEYLGNNRISLTINQSTVIVFNNLNYKIESIQILHNGTPKTITHFRYA